MRHGESRAGRFPHCKTWDYWARGGKDGRAGPECDCDDCTEGEREREAWAAGLVAEARRRARATIAREIEAGRWWVPRGFTVADLDALIAEVY